MYPPSGERLREVISDVLFPGDLFHRFFPVSSKRQMLPSNVAVAIVLPSSEIPMKSRKCPLFEVSFPDIRFRSSPVGFVFHRSDA